MKSNQFFSPQRFVMLLRYDLIINYKKYIFTAVGAFIAGFLLLYTALPSKHSFNSFPMQAYWELLIPALLAFGAFVGLSFPEAGNKINLTRYLLLPASNFEKFTSQFTIRILLGGLLFLAIFWVDAYLARIVIVNSAESLGLVSQIEPFSYSSLLDTIKSDKEYPLIFLTIFAIGFYLFSSRLFFGKFGLVKSLIGLTALGYIFSLLMVMFTHIFYPETIGFKVNITDYIVYKEYSNMELFIGFMATLSIITLLPLGYFKLKEKQL